jgi:hypothetical protein
MPRQASTTVNILYIGEVSGSATCAAGAEIVPSFPNHCAIRRVARLHPGARSGVTPPTRDRVSLWAVERVGGVRSTRTPWSRLPYETNRAATSRNRTAAPSCPAYRPTPAALGAADQQIARHEADVARVGAVVAVIAQHHVLARRHRHRAEIARRRSTCGKNWTRRACPSRRSLMRSAGTCAALPAGSITCCAASYWACWPLMISARCASRPRLPAARPGA